MVYMTEDSSKNEEGDEEKNDGKKGSKRAERRVFGPCAKHPLLRYTIVRLQDAHVRVQESNRVRRVFLEPCDGDLFSEPRNHVAVNVRLVGLFHHQVNKHFVKSGVPVRAGECRPGDLEAVCVRRGESVAQALFGPTGGPLWADLVADLLHSVVLREAHLQMVSNTFRTCAADVIEADPAQLRWATWSSVCLKEAVGHCRKEIEADVFQGRHREVDQEFGFDESPRSEMEVSQVAEGR